MKTTDPEMGSAAELLYGSEQETTDSKLPNPINNYNIFGPPSLTPGVEFPLSDKEERIRKAGYDQGFNDAARIYRNEEDPFLKILRKRLKQIRRNLVEKGKVEPINNEEERWVR